MRNIHSQIQQMYFQSCNCMPKQQITGDPWVENTKRLDLFMEVTMQELEAEQQLDSNYKLEHRDSDNETEYNNLHTDHESPVVNPPINCCQNSTSM